MPQSHPVSFKLASSASDHFGTEKKQLEGQVVDLLRLRRDAIENQGVEIKKTMMQAQTTFNVGQFLDRQKIGRFHLLVMTLCALIMCVDGYDVYIVAFTNVPMAKAFGIAPQAMTPALVLQGAGIGIGSYVMSWLADRYGRRPVLLWCASIFGIFTLFASRSTSVAEFASLRLLSGLFFGGLYPNALAIVGEISPRRMRSTVISIMLLGYVLGPVLGAAAAGLVIAPYGWPSAYVLGGAVTLVVVPILYFLLPESIRFSVQRNRTDPRIGALLHRIDRSLELLGNERYILGERGEERRSAVAELFREGRAGKTVFLWTAFVLTGLVLSMLSVWLPTFFAATGGLSTQRAAGLTGIYAMSGLIATPICGIAVDRWSAPARAALPLLVITCLAMVSLGQVDPHSLALYLALILTGGGINGSYAVMTALATFLYPTRIRSMGVGWAQGISRIGALIGPAMGGVVLAAHLTLGWILTASASVILLAALAILIVWQLQRGDEALGNASPRPSAR